MLKISIVISIVALLCSNTVYATTYYVCGNGTTCGTGWATGASGNNGTSKTTPKATITQGIAAMSGGDTLVVGNGTYVNDRIRNVPSGSTGAWTTVRAENVGGVLLDLSTGIDYETTGITTGSADHHIQFEGFKIKGSLDVPANGVVFSQGDYIKFFRIATYNARSTGNANVFVIGSGSDHVLVEECWAWGTGRYKFEVYESSNVIVRKCVARHDYQTDSPGSQGQTQQATFANYDSTNTHFQNCISIDSGVEGSDQVLYGAFWDEHNEEEVDKSGKITGSIVLNIRTNLAAMFDKVSGTRHITNSVVWDSNGGWNSSYPINGPAATVYLQNNTFGNLVATYNDGKRGWGTGASDSWGANASIQDSIIYGANSYGVAWYMDSDYNVMYNNGANYGQGATAGTHDYSNVNPMWNASTNPNGCLKYLPRIEDGSSCANLSSAGGKVGATIMYQHGTSETLYGETGYDALTEDPLWPFPNEDLIKADFASYDGPGPVGARGFAASGTQLNGVDDITLTSYIWEYLGNEMPSDIYGEAGDTTPPTTNPSKAAGKYTGPQSVTLTPSETATIYYTIDGSTPTESSTQYSAAISVLQNEALTTLKYFAKDAAGNSSAVQTQVYKCQRCK